MSDVARQSEPMGPPPDGWLTAGQAARAMGRAERSIVRYCGAGKLVARQCVDDAGRVVWAIDPACKPTLWLAAGHAEAIPAIAGSPLAGLTDAKRRGILARREIVEAFERSLAQRPAGYNVRRWASVWLAHWSAVHAQHGIHVATLFRWRASIRDEGLAGLADRRGGFDRVERNAYLWRAFTGLYCRESRLTMRVAYDIVAAEAASLELPWPSLRTVQRWVKELLPPIEIAAGRDPTRFEDRFVPHVDRDWSRVAAMECWVADNRMLDVRVRVPRRGRGGRIEWIAVRPYVQAWIDARSWFPVAWQLYAEPSRAKGRQVREPGGQETAELFAAGVSLHGAPAHAYLDNGSGFRADAFSGGRPNRKRPDDADANADRLHPVVEQLGTAVHFALPYNHKAKIVEPWFKFVATEFDKLWRSYLGNAVANRPGEADRIPVHKLPTLAELREMFGEWLVGTFCRMPSPAKAAAGLSPMRAFTELREPGRQYAKPSDDTLALICRPSTPVRVYANGVWVHEYDCWYWHEKLVDRQGSGRDAKRKVSYRLLPGRRDVVFIFDEVGKLLCTAEPYAGGNMDPLIDGATEAGAAEQNRLGQVMELRGAIAKHYTRKVAAYREHADAVLLAGQRRGAEATGRYDADAPPPPEPGVIQLKPHLDQAAAAMARETSGEAAAERAATGTRRTRLMDFLEIEPAEGAKAKSPGQGGLIDELMGNDSTEGNIE